MTEPTRRLATRVEPTRRLATTSTKPCPYRPSYATDIRATFRRIQRQQRAAKE